jgi:hypothetical protein
MCFLRFGKPRLGWEDKNKMDFIETGWDGVVWNDLFQEWDV